MSVRAGVNDRVIVGARTRGQSQASGYFLAFFILILRYLRMVRVTFLLLYLLIRKERRKGAEKKIWVAA